MTLEEFLQILIEAVQRYFIVIAIVAVLSLLLIFFNFWNAGAKFLSSIFTFLKYLCLGVFYFFKYLFKLLFKVLLVKYLILGIVNLIKRFLKRRRLRNGSFNVYPVRYSFNFFHKIFSRKLRNQLNYRYNVLEACEKTHDSINNNFTYLVRIEAAVGGGKTSFLNGYAHMRTLLFKEKIRDTCLSIETRFHSFPFHLIRRKIKELYKQGESEKAILTALYKEKYINDQFNGSKVYSDYIKEEPAPVILKSYAIAYMAELRDNFVMANYKLFNRITGKYNYELDETLFHIKDSSALKRFYLPAYSLIIEDEKALSSDSNVYDYREVAATGSSTILRLFRQLRGETTYYISSTQNSERIAKPIRELTNSFLRITSCDVIGNLPGWNNKQKKKEKKIYKKMLKKAEKKSRGDKNLAELWLHSDNSFKIKLFKIWDKKKKVLAASFLRYKIRLATSIRDLDEPERYKELSLVFPLSWCWGVYRTCEYSDFYEYLQKQQEQPLTDKDLVEVSSLWESNEDTYKKLIKGREEEQIQKEETKAYIKKKGSQKGKEKAEKELKEEKGREEEA